MDGLKVYIRHVMLWEFKNSKNAKETAKKISSFTGQGIISDRPVWNWFSEFYSSNTLFRG